jgi:putative nucleotidyltransferase with HDIG domain
MKTPAVEGSLAVADPTAMEGLLAAAREVLGMELAYLAEVRESTLVLREVAGDRASYNGVRAGFSLPSGHSWCHAMVSGSLPQLVADSRSMPEARDHPFIAATGIRAYAGVPVHKADGTLYGSLCCLSRRPKPDLGERDLGFLRILARIATDLLAAAEGSERHRRAEVEAAAGQALLAALNARENYTAAHSEAVLALALQVAGELGMEDDDVTSVGQVALLHDIGKVGVPDAILLKPAQLSPGELDIIRTHPAMGARILSGSRVPLLRMAEEIAHAHHERWDGRGYPHGRSGEGIPLAGRIVALADAFDAMTHDRPYKRGIAPERAFEVVESERGRHFDPQVVDAFARVFPDLPATLA